MFYLLGLSQNGPKNSSVHVHVNSPWFSPGMQVPLFLQGLGSQGSETVKNELINMKQAGTHAMHFELTEVMLICLMFFFGGL